MMDYYTLYCVVVVVCAACAIELYNNMRVVCAKLIMNNAKN